MYFKFFKILYSRLNNKKNPCLVWGFTLIETIIAIAILTIIASLGLVFGIDFYKTYSLDAERNMIVSVLQKARSRAQNNINQSPHGVSFQANEYIIFQGASYISRSVAYDQIIPKNPAIVVNGFSEAVFEQLNGNSQTIGDIVLDNGKRLAIISINNEGRINW